MLLFIDGEVEEKEEGDGRRKENWMKDVPQHSLRSGFTGLSGRHVLGAILVIGGSVERADRKMIREKLSLTWQDRILLAQGKLHHLESFIACRRNSRMQFSMTFRVLSFAIHQGISGDGSGIRWYAHNWQAISHGKVNTIYH